MRTLLRLALLLAALLPAAPQAQAASSVAGSWPTNAIALTDGATISPPCPGQSGASGFYTLTVTGNSHTISLPQCNVPSDFKFAITQGAGGPWTGLSFSSAGTIKWPGGTAYTQTNTAGALDYVGGAISNLTGSNEWDVTGITTIAVVGAPAPLVSNKATNGGSGASVVVTMTGYTGHAMLIGTSWCDGGSCNTTGAVVTSITATGGNTCSAVSGALNNPSGFKSQLWACGTGTSGTNTVTVNCSGGGGCFYLTALANEFSVIAGSCEVGNQFNSSGTTVSLATSGATTHSNEVIYSIVASNQVVTPNQTVLNSNSAAGINETDEYQIGVSPGTYTNTYALGGSGAYSVVVAGCF